MKTILRHLKNLFFFFFFNLGYVTLFQKARITNLGVSIGALLVLLVKSGHHIDKMPVILHPLLRPASRLLLLLGHLVSLVSHFLSLHGPENRELSLPAFGLHLPGLSALPPHTS